MPSRDIADIYGEEHVKFPSAVPSKALTRATVPVLQDLPTRTTIRRWSAPQFPREKLVETLNTLEVSGFEIFTILTVSASTIQVVYYDEKETE
jgi:hypothetical protein